MTELRDDLGQALHMLRRALLRAGGDAQGLTITVSPKDSLVIKHALKPMDLVPTMREDPDPTMVAEFAGVKIRWAATGYIRRDHSVDWS